MSFRSDCYRMSLMSSTNCWGHLPQVPLVLAAPPAARYAQDLGAAGAETGQPGCAGSGEGRGKVRLVLHPQLLGMMSYHYNHIHVDDILSYLITILSDDYLNSYYNQP